jgi:hypothetical protein
MNPTNTGPDTAGNPPVRITVHYQQPGDALSDWQRSEVEFAYQRFRLEVDASVVPLHSQTYVLMDGTQVLITSVGGHDDVEVWPAPAPQKEEKKFGGIGMVLTDDEGAVIPGYGMTVGGIPNAAPQPIVLTFGARGAIRIVKVDRIVGGLWLWVNQDHKHWYAIDRTKQYATHGNETMGAVTNEGGPNAISSAPFRYRHEEDFRIGYFQGYAPPTFRSGPERTVTGLESRAITPADLIEDTASPVALPNGYHIDTGREISVSQDGRTAVVVATDVTGARDKLIAFDIVGTEATARLMGTGEEARKDIFEGTYTYSLNESPSPYYVIDIANPGYRNRLVGFDIDTVVQATEGRTYTLATTDLLDAVYSRKGGGLVTTTYFEETSGTAAPGSDSSVTHSASWSGEVYSSVRRVEVTEATHTTGEIKEKWASGAVKSFSIREFTYTAHFITNSTSRGSGAGATSTSDGEGTEVAANSRRYVLLIDPDRAVRISAVVTNSYSKSLGEFDGFTPTWPQIPLTAEESEATLKLTVEVAGLNVFEEDLPPADTSISGFPLFSHYSGESPTVPSFSGVWMSELPEHEFDPVPWTWSSGSYSITDDTAPVLPEGTYSLRMVASIYERFSVSFARDPITSALVVFLVHIDPVTEETTRWSFVFSDAGFQHLHDVLGLPPSTAILLKDNSQSSLVSI